LRRPAELALDLLDELADLGGRGVRLLALDADKRNLVFSIVEQNVKDSVGHESYTNDSNEQRNVFGEQTAPGLPEWRFGWRGLARAVIHLHLLLCLLRARKMLDDVVHLQSHRTKVAVAPFLGRILIRSPRRRERAEAVAW